MLRAFLLTGLLCSSQIVFAAENKATTESCNPSSCQPVAVINADNQAVLECARPCKPNTINIEPTPCKNNPQSLMNSKRNPQN